MPASIWVDQGLLEIIAAATEYESLEVRPGEEEAIRRLLMHAPLALDRPKYNDPHTKANALLQVRSQTSLNWIFLCN